jgi:tetratricopeptide (TPR) repeat protein
MSHLLTATLKTGHRVRIWAWPLIVLLASLALPANAQAPDRSATIVGSVRDASGAAIAGTSIVLRSENQTVIQTASTDLHGNYRFAGVNPGTYTLRASTAAYNSASFGPFIVEDGETKSIDLMLKRISSAERNPSSPAMPEFSDEPNFTVAGVADPTNLGGHGSDVVVRSREGLAKATVSLSAGSPDAAQTAASLAVTEESLRDEVERDAGSYEANYRLGSVLVEEGRARKAIPYLEHASQIRAGAYESEYELALAHCIAGDYEVAAEETRILLARQDKAELHHLLGEIEEKRDDPLDAVVQYQRAAELDPSEPNYFDWGAELLLHQAPEPAIEVFAKGNRLFPGSVRMLTALGAAWYVHGASDQAVETLCRASDLDPNSTAPYMFLGRIQDGERSENPEAVRRLARFARLQPADGWANYYYAVSLWKQRHGPDDNKNLPEIQSLLEAAVHLEPKLGAAYLQLGILYSEKKKSPAAIAAYLKAAENSPDFPDAHYRLAQAYRQAGEELKAQRELQLYQQTSTKAAEDVERERHEVRQFVYKLRDQTSPSRPQ